MSLFDPFRLPCGVTLKNRIAKSAMSDSLGDGTGHPTVTQLNLYQHWASGGVALSIIGEVQVCRRSAERPGNLVLDNASDIDRLRNLAHSGTKNGCQLWVQLGHAGALSYPPISTPKGPSALNLPELKCAELKRNEIRMLPTKFARSAKIAQEAGFGGVEIHAAHGFLLSQFLSPLFNHRDDEYGGDISGRMHLLLQVVEAVRVAVGANFPIAVKLNSSDQLKGGLNQSDALSVIAALDATSIDLIDISGGTYFPGSVSASDSKGRGPYFVDFAKRAKNVTTKPLMVTGGFKTCTQAEKAVHCGSVDIVGIARAMVLEPSLPNLWKVGQMNEPTFPRFTDPPEGGITAWYTLRLTEIGENREALKPNDNPNNMEQLLKTYEARDLERAKVWCDYSAELVCSPVSH